MQFIQGSAKTQSGELIFSMSQSKLTADGIRTQTSQTLGQALVLAPPFRFHFSFCTSGLNLNPQDLSNVCISISDPTCPNPKSGAICKPSGQC